MGTKRTDGPETPRVSLQQRDLRIMEALVLLRAETLDEIHARHFTGLSRKRAVNRLAQLSRAGFLAPADVILFGESAPTRVYTLGSKARTALERRSLSSEHFRFRRWNPTLRDASIPHQVAVNRLGQQLGASMLPEHLLPVLDKNGARNRPDAVVEGVVMDGGTRMLGIEVDLGHYSRERVVGKLDAWRSYPDGGTLVFVVPDRARAERVRGWLDRARDATVLTFEELGNEIDVARSATGEGVLFGLDIWTGGDAWEPSRERQRAHEQRQKDEDQRHAELRERERLERLALLEAKRRENERLATRRNRRRFGV